MCLLHGDARKKKNRSAIVRGDRGFKNSTGIKKLRKKGTASQETSGSGFQGGKFA